MFGIRSDWGRTKVPSGPMKCYVIVPGPSFRARVYPGITINSNRYGAAQRPPRQLEGPHRQCWKRGYCWSTAPPSHFEREGSCLASGSASMQRGASSLFISLPFQHTFPPAKRVHAEVAKSTMNRDREYVQSIMLKIILIYYATLISHFMAFDVLRRALRLPHFSLVVPSMCRRYSGADFHIFFVIARPGVDVLITEWATG
ncbi:hypothetical protein AB1N83_013559 [Pleurotus pulmonarius]